MYLHTDSFNVITQFFTSIIVKGIKQSATVMINSKFRTLFATYFNVDTNYNATLEGEYEFSVEQLLANYTDHLLNQYYSLGMVTL